ncbi:MAG: LAGLIDADG family homing endonuclease [Candidatus Woesearchaeota archaeon]
MKNYQVAEIIGAFIGDGWIESDIDGLYITGSAIEDKDYYDNFLAPLFSKYFIKVNPKNFPYWKVYGICTYKKRIIKKAISLGFEIGRKAHKVMIPDWIMNSSDTNIKKAVVRGIFDTDGSFWCEKSRSKSSSTWKRTHNYHPELSITSISKELLTQIKEILDQLNIKSKIDIKNKKGIKCDRNISNSYALRVRRIQDIKNWFRIIKSNNPRHQTRYSVWLKFGFLKPYTNYHDRKKLLSM